MRRHLVALALLAGACGSDESPGVLDRAAVPEPAPTTTAAPPPITAPPPPLFPPIEHDGQAKAVVTPTGIVLPVRGAAPTGAHVVATPCGNEAVVAGGMPITGAHVVLDPGHGGVEIGTAGDTDGDGNREYAEKALNLSVALKVKERLEAQGATVVMTRTDDYRIALRTRAEIGMRLRPLAFVSIHFNGEHDIVSDVPGTETYFQIASPESRRLAGLVYEDVFAALQQYDGVAWVADRDFGTKYRPADDGGDYYGILRRTAGIPAVLAELGFLNNPPEAALYVRDDVQDVLADAVTRAVVRFVGTDDPGSGYVEPYPRESPAGSGGGVRGCVDPPLG